MLFAALQPTAGTHQQSHRRFLGALPPRLTDSDSSADVTCDDMPRSRTCAKPTNLSGGAACILLAWLPPRLASSKAGQLFVCIQGQVSQLGLSPVPVRYLQGHSAVSEIEADSDSSCRSQMPNCSTLVLSISASSMLCSLLLLIWLRSMVCVSSGKRKNASLPVCSRDFWQSDALMSIAGGWLHECRAGGGRHSI